MLLVSVINVYIYSLQAQFEITLMTSESCLQGHKRHFRNYFLSDFDV